MKTNQNPPQIHHNTTKMDVQGKGESPVPSLPATSPSTTEFNSYSTVSTNDSYSPVHILNLPKSTNRINLPSGLHMNRGYDVPDPNRIPKSIFAGTNSKSAQKEWSVTSNESLFSIHVAKSSDLPNAIIENPESLQTELPEKTMEGLKKGISGPFIEAESEQQEGDFKEKLQLNVKLSSNSNFNINLSALTTPCESPGSGMSGLNSETSTLSHNSFAFPV